MTLNNSLIMPFSPPSPSSPKKSSLNSFQVTRPSGSSPKGKITLNVPDSTLPVDLLTIGSAINPSSVNESLMFLSLDGLPK